MRGGRHKAAPPSTNQKRRVSTARCCYDTESRVYREGSSNFECSSLLQNARKFHRFQHTVVVESPCYDMAADHYYSMLFGVLHFLLRGGRLVVFWNMNYSSEGLAFIIV